MASRLSAVALNISQNGNQFGAGQAGVSQVDINLSPVPALNLNSALSNAILGTTIRGNVVNTIECWSDGVVWDVTNTRALITNLDYDPTLRMRSGL
jgi:hypothetical protein